VERNRSLDALHHKLAQRALHLGDGLGTVASVHNQLGDQRVVVRRDDALGVLRRIHAHAVAAGNIERRNLAGRRSELSGMFGVDAALDGVAANLKLRGRMSLSRSPEAIRNCALTISTPVMASVIGCSTWMRVFISMK
jgi:hypothetical protein